MASLGSLALRAGEPPSAGEYPPERPLFARHVVPLLSRLGCNAGACHGKVKGENGFRLSLFGVDPAQDHQSLLREFGGRRVNLLRVEASLLLQKPSGGVAHAGGALLAPEGPDHELVRRWLAHGAALDDLAASRVTRLTISPERHTLRVDEKVFPRVTAEFADGSREDVTRLCRFEAVHGDVAKATPDGEVVGRAIGDTAIVARYGAEPVVAMVIVPGSPIKFPGGAPHNFVDEHVFAKLRALQVAPADVCDDAAFLRRASLDIAGVLPSPAEARAFLADTAADKRAKKIDELLARPEHFALWATRLCDVLRPSGYDANYALIEPAENRRFHDWIRARLRENTPYDELAARVVAATSREGRSYEEWIDEVLALAEENARAADELPTYARRHTLDLYWQRKDATGVKGAVQFAHAFLGLRLECAQCHRHPHDVWSQDDLLSFANFFNQLKGAAYPDKKQMPEAIAKMFEELPKEAKKLEEPLKQLREKKLKDASGQLSKTRDELSKAKSAGEGKVDEGKIRELEQRLADQTAEKTAIEQEIAALETKRGRMLEGPKRFGTDVRHNSDRVNYASVSSPLGSQRSEKFRLLGDHAPVAASKEQDPRELVAAWLRRPDNPFFAKALVNRVWAHYLGRGIVDPPDQLSPLNPPSHPELLDELTRQFIENKYDLRWLHRVIAGSRAYQLSSRPAAGTVEQVAAARRNFGVFALRRLPAETLVDAVNTATGGRESYPAKLFIPPEARAIEVAGVTRREDQEASVAYAFKIFGRPERSAEAQCDCERDASPTIVQTLYLANHPAVLAKIYSDQGRVAQVRAEIAAPERRIQELYYIALGRPPLADELASCAAYVAQREHATRAYQDVLWSLLNTREFVLNH